MRSKLLFLCAAGALLASVSAASAHEAFVRTPVYLHTHSNARSDIILTVPAYTSFRLIGCARWCEIQYGAVVGYVWSPYVVAGDPAWDTGPIGLLEAPIVAADDIVEGVVAPVVAPVTAPVVAAY